VFTGFSDLLIYDFSRYPCVYHFLLLYISFSVYVNISPAPLYSYASRLQLITEDFRAAIAELNSKGKAVIPENVVSHIFLNIRQIYTLSQQILSDLQKRMDNWKEIEEIGDVLSTLAPFLKVSDLASSVEICQTCCDDFTISFDDFICV